MSCSFPFQLHGSGNNILSYSILENFPSLTTRFHEIVGSTDTGTRLHSLNPTQSSASWVILGKFIHLFVPVFLSLK